MEIRDLIWVQQLVMEMQMGVGVGGSYMDFFETSQDFLADLRMIARSTEVAALCIKDLSAELGLQVDFNRVDSMRKAGRPQSHPCCLIQPYLDHYDSDGSDSTELSVSDGTEASDSA